MAKAKPPQQHRPGDYPHMRTGHLRSNVVAEHNKKEMTSRIGTNVPYGRFLELGLLQGGVRYPWLSRGLVEHATTIRRILTEGKL